MTMKNEINSPGRRRFLQSVAALSAASAVPAWAQPQTGQKLMRTIPGTTESIPVIGMGSWGTFDIGNDDKLRRDRTAVLQHFFDQGGALVDSSPMYGSSETNIGRCLQTTGSKKLFSATKVWVLGQERGVAQMQESAKLWGVPRFDLMQIHNFV
ncbi:MAG: aldo/keto reductase, partial [Gammaproteobacteria bacterium]|nr:aldo/keto reductase [Gammaproteobacteria bacterium]